MDSKEKIFDIFSENLLNIAKFWNFDFDSKEKGENYICPLSFKIFTKDGLNQKYIDQLTLEHIPPESLMGKPLCLTSKKENNSSGATFDKSLQEVVEIEKIKKGLMPLSARVYFDGGFSMNAKFSFGIKPTIDFRFHFITKEIEKHLSSIKNGTTKEIKFKFSKKNYSKYFPIAILKTAYLTAFSHLGYSLLFGFTKLVNQNYLEIRKAISNQEIERFNNFIILENELENINSPINIITEPSDIRSLLVVFELKSEGIKKKYGVFLPGPDDYGFKAIKQIKEKIEIYKRIDFKYISFPKLNLESYDDSIEYYRKWKEVHGIFKNTDSASN